jgi:hypothetical protein
VIPARCRQHVAVRVGDQEHIRLDAIGKLAELALVALEAASSDW